MNQLFDSIFFLRINLQIYFYFLKNRRAWLQLFRLRFYILVSFLKNIFSNKKICSYSFWHLWVWHCRSFTYGLRIPLNHFQNNPTSTKNPRACLPNLYLPLFFFFSLLGILYYRSRFEKFRAKNISIAKLLLFEAIFVDPRGNTWLWRNYFDPLATSPLFIKVSPLILSLPFRDRENEKREKGGGEWKVCGIISHRYERHDSRWWSTAYRKPFLLFPTTSSVQLIIYQTLR